MPVDDNTGLVQAPFTITKNSSGSTFLSGDLGNSATYQDVLVYAVPLGQAIKIEPFHYFFGFYYATDTTTKITAGTTRMQKCNSTRDENRTLWEGSNAIFKDVGDERQRPKLTIQVVLSASEKLAIQVANLATTLDQGVSDFHIQCWQVYQQI